jgi:catechol 2,3-dioxygenase-like lactoylglutathione lyase family enzyme
MSNVERVTGIGGVFFRATNPVELAHWYRDMLGVDSGVDGETVWRQEPGPTVFSPVASDAPYYFAGPEQAVMVNFRVDDLDAMLAQLRAAGADVDDEIETEEGTGRFAWVTDPEGNRIQLWEPHFEN